MKEFKKTKDGLFVCEECNKICKSKQILVVHIKKYHIKKDYFDKWIKDENDGKCVICNEETTFKDFQIGYRNCCSTKCTLQLRRRTKKEKYGDENFCNYEKVKQTVKNNKKNSEYQININKKVKQTRKAKYSDENFNNRAKANKTNLERYGVKNALQNKEIHDKFEQTCLERFGVKNPFQSEENKSKIKETNLKNLGVEYPMQSEVVKEKSKQIINKKYRVDNVFQNEDIKEKCKQTSLKNNGVEYGLQNKKIFEKAQKSALKVKYFKDINIYYRGSYELDFLEKYFNLYPDIKNAASIKYKYNGKFKTYYPDFYIPSLNLIVEIKNSYLAKRDKNQIEKKKKAVIINGLKYCIVVDKNYQDFTEIIK